MEYTELASKIRSKYPGSYDDLDDESLARKIISKYPQYSDTTFDVTPAAAQEGASPFVQGVADAVNPPVEIPQDISAPSTWNRVLTASKEALMAPIAPFIPSLRKRLFSPQVGQAGPSKVLEEEGRRLGEAVRGSSVTSKIAESPLGPNIPKPAYFPMAMGATAIDAVSDTLTPTGAAQQIGGDAMAGVAKGIGPILKDAAIDPARRALGFQKSQLVSHKSPFETGRKVAQANRSAKAMLEEGVISPTGNVEDSIQKATKVLSENSKKISSVIDSVDKTGKKIAIKDIDSVLIDELKPKFEDDFTVTDKILKDLKAFSKDGLTLNEVDELRARWGKIGFQDKTVGTTAADMYRKAWGTIDRIVKKHIEAVDPDLVGAYKTAKAGQENAINALKGLGNKQAADLGNNVFSLPTKVLAAGQLATGNIPAAIVTAGVAEGVKRRGLATVAKGLFGAGKAIEAGARPGFAGALGATVKEATTDRPAPSPKLFSAAIQKAKAGQKPKFNVGGILSPDTTSASATTPNRPADVQAYITGLEAILKNDLGGARVAAKKALQLNPQNAEAEMLLRRIAKMEGKPGQRGTGKQ